LFEALLTATTLVKEQRFSDVDLRRLETGLAYLLRELDYEDPRFAVEEDLGLLRRDCVRLALALLNAGCDSRPARDWIATAENDPLPEVRFATENND
jgi:hypothetical protein